MRTLKKTLCLVLVLAMMVGLCAFAALADDFTDADKIEHADAVAVLSGMGVIKGNPDGSFNPTGTLTRAEAAVILVRMLGLDDIVAKSTFTDIVTDTYDCTWADSAIAILQAKGIVAGIGDGKFNPQGKLTGAAWGKMLLKALGSTDPDLDDPDRWEIAVATGVKATNPSLKKDLDKFDGTAEISRDDAAQMAWNGIWVSEKGEQIEYVVTSGTTELYRGTDPVAANNAKNAIPGAAIAFSKSAGDSLGGENFGLKEDTSTDPFGRTSKTYTDGNQTTYATFAPEAIATYTDGVTDAKIAAAVGATTTASVNLTYITDGIPAAATPVFKDGTGLPGARVATPIAAPGTLVEVYKTGKTTANVVIINTYVYELTAADVVAAKAATGTTDAVAAHINLKIGAATYTFNTASFAKGDVVLFTIGDADQDGAIDAAAVNAVKANSQSGTVTRANVAGNWFNLGDAQMSFSANAYAINSANAVVNPAVAGTDPFDVGRDTTVYFDDYGNVIYAKVTAAAAAPSYKLVYVIESAAQIKQGAADIWGTVSSTDVQAIAKILNLETGAIETVNLGLVENAAGKLCFANENGTASAVQVNADHSTLNAIGVDVYGCFDGTNYTGSWHKANIAEDGTYNINPAVVAPQALAVTAKQAAATLDLAAVYLKSSTVFTTISYKLSNNHIASASVTTTTGYAAITSNTNFNGQAKVETVGAVTNVDSFIAIKLATTTTTSKVTYAVYAGLGDQVWDSSTNAMVQYYAFYVGGKLVSYPANAASVTTIGGAAVGDVFDLTLTNGVINKAGGTGLAAATANATVSGGTIKAIQGEYIVVTKGTTDYTVYFKTNGCTIVDGTAQYAAYELGVGDTVTIYATKSDGTPAAVSGTTLSGADFIIVTAKA